MNINQLNTLEYRTSSLSTASAVPIKKDPVVDVQTLVLDESKAMDNSNKQARHAAEKIQNAVDTLTQKDLRFSIDEDTGKTIIKVVDAHTDELIRQIPSEEAIEIARALDKVKGLLFNDKA